MNAGRPAPHRSTPFFSPVGLMRRAAWLVGLFLVAHFLGLGQYVSALALTFPPGTDPRVGLALAGIYLLLWFLMVFLAPVFALAAPLLAMLGRMGPPLEEP